MATQLEVFGLVGDAHAPAANPAEYAVVGNRLPHGFGVSGHWVDMLGGGQGDGRSHCLPKVPSAAIAIWRTRLWLA